MSRVREVSPSSDEFTGIAPEVSGRVRERRDAAVHREQILAAAARLFAQRGVNAVTMDEIARAAGVGKGTLYRRYAHKGFLCLAMMEACWRKFQQQTVDELACSADVLSSLERLDVFLRRLVDWIEDYIDWLGVIADAAREQPGGVCRGVLFQWPHRVVVDLLDQANSQGEAAVQDPIYTADVLLAALAVDLYAYQRRVRGYTPEQIHRGLSRIVGALRSR